MTWNWQQNDWPNWRFDPAAMAQLESDFLLAAGQLKGLWQYLDSSDKDQIQSDLLSDEAVKTSAIEGEILDRDSVQSSVRQQLGLQPLQKSQPAESGIAELMVRCFQDFADNPTHASLGDWHRLICRGRNDLSIIGGYRTHETPMQVVSGPYQKQKVHFEAPPSVQMNEEMDRFINWFAGSHPKSTGPLPALTRAALIHLYFVSIHPFEDGNGRMARTLSEQALAQALGEPSLVALSRQIERERKTYYAALEANNKQMDVTDWLVWFGETVLAAQQYSIAMVRHLIAKTKMFDALRDQINERQEKVLLRLFAAGPEGFKGGLNAGNYQTITGAVPATARRDLSDLVAKGALTRTGERKGTRYWLNIES